MTLECVSDSLLGDIPNLGRQTSCYVQHSADDGDNDRRHENSGTYSDRLVLGPSCEQFAVRAKAYAPNVQIIRIVRSFIHQDAVQ